MATSSFQTLTYIKIEELFSFFFLSHIKLCLKNRAKIICENIMCNCINIHNYLQIYTHIQSIKEPITLSSNNISAKSQFSGSAKILNTEYSAFKRKSSQFDYVVLLNNWLFSWLVNNWYMSHWGKEAAFKANTILLNYSGRHHENLKKKMPTHNQKKAWMSPKSAGNPTHPSCLRP